MTGDEVKQVEQSLERQILDQVEKLPVDKQRGSLISLANWPGRRGNALKN